MSLAQYGLESAWGTKTTGKYNYFGIKAIQGDSFTTCPTHEVIHGVSCKVLANFKNFTSISDAFDYHAKLLATSPYYSQAIADKAHPEEFAEHLQHYATDPDYGDKLVQIMRQSGLEKYDA